MLNCSNKAIVTRSSLLIMVLILQSVYSYAQKRQVSNWPNGGIKEEGMVIESVKHGQWFSYDESGRLLTETWYSSGKDSASVAYEYDSYGDVYSKRISRAGIIEEEITYPKQGLSNHVHFHANGRIMREGQNRDQLRIGKWKYYDAEGKLLHELRYKDGLAIKLDGKELTEEKELVIGLDTIRIQASEPKNIPGLEEILDGLVFFNDDIGEVLNVAVQLDGYAEGMVYMSNDTLEGYIKMINQNTIKFTDLKTKAKYKASQVKGFSIGEAKFVTCGFRTDRPAGFEPKFYQLVRQAANFEVLAEDFYVDKSPVKGIAPSAGLNLNAFSKIPHGFNRVYAIYQDGELMRVLSARQKDGKLRCLASPKKLSAFVLLCAEGEEPSLENFECDELELLNKLKRCD